MAKSATYPKTDGAPQDPSKTIIKVTALDSFVNVNSLFTFAVFVGLSLTTPGQKSLENRGVCDADLEVAKRLFSFEVLSFSFFLFSSLVAQGFKLTINLLNSKEVNASKVLVNKKCFRAAMIASATGSVMGIVFLVLSMVHAIEIRLGLLSCGSKFTICTVAAMVLLASLGLLVYISAAVYPLFLQDEISESNSVI